jgi:hypothetical protein
MTNNEEGTFEAPETTGRMPVTTWVLLYSMDGDKRRACEFPMADPGDSTTSTAALPMPPPCPVR